MAIYSLNGDGINSAYGFDGEALPTAYDIDGDLVYSQTPPQRDYDNYTISSMFTYGSSAMQGFAIYNGIIAQIREGYTLHLIDIATKSLIREVALDDMNHGNSCQFSDEFYDENDEFPLFYERSNRINVYRITGTTSTIVKQYSFPTETLGTYVAGFGIDCENRKFYTASYTEGDYTTKTGLLRICVWDMDDVTEIDTNVYRMAFISSNDLTWFTTYDAVQGCCFHDGYFFIATGMHASQYVVLVDGETLTIAHSVLITGTAEIQGCGWADDDYMVVGQNHTIVYKKVEFGTT